MEMTFFKKTMLYATFAMAATFFVGCSDSDDETGGFGSGKVVKLQKLDIDGAKYLSLTGESTKATGSDEVGLFKIDAEGNMTTVVLSCTEEEDGTVTRTRKDIKVIPREIYSLSGLYTFLCCCEFTDSEGGRVDMQLYYEPDAFYFHILVRNSDGAIFYIPEVLHEEYFARYNYYNLKNTIADDKNNLFLLGINGNNLGMITIQDGQVVLKQVNPNGVPPSEGNCVLLDNGTIMTGGENSQEATFFYPNGGFERYEMWDLDGTYGNSLGGIYAIKKVSDGIKAVKITEGDIFYYRYREYTVSLHDFYVGTSAGSLALSAPLAALSSGTNYSTNLGDPNYLDWVSKFIINPGWLGSIYETTNNYIIGQCLVVDKNTMEIRALNWDESNSIIIPTAENTYKNRAWKINTWGAEWYDIEAMQSGTVYFNLPADFLTTSTTAEIPSGQFIVSGTRYADGKSVTFFVDIETGNYVYTETDSERPITALVPLN